MSAQQTPRIVVETFAALSELECEASRLRGLLTMWQSTAPAVRNEAVLRRALEAILDVPGNATVANCHFIAAEALRDSGAGGGLT